MDWEEGKKYEKKDFRKLYEELVKSDWFKKAYNNKSLGECPLDFPELRESEEERIRKWLYDYISYCPNTNFAFYDGIDKKAVLNYLEKQKEQKPDNKCKGCNNVKGCINCVDGSEWAHIEEIEQKPAECSKDTLIEWAKSVLKCQEEELAKYDGPCYGKASTMGRIDAYKVLIAKLNSL